MKMMAPSRQARSTSVVKRRRPALWLLLHDGFEAGLEEGDLALFEAGDLGGVDVGAEDVVADVGEAGADDEADVAAADDGDSHGGEVSGRGGVFRGL
jgi:hypothetical protein